MEGAKRESTQRKPVAQEELQHGVSEQNSTALSHPKCCRSWAAGASLPPAQPTPLRLWEMLPGRSLAPNFHLQSQGLGKSKESFGNLCLVALNIYCTPATRSQNCRVHSCRQPVVWALAAPNQPGQVLIKTSP